MFQPNTEFEKKPNPVGYFVFFPIGEGVGKVSESAEVGDGSG